VGRGIQKLFKEEIMKYRFSLNGSQVNAFLLILQRINESISGSDLPPVKYHAVKETIWKLYVKLAARMPSIKHYALNKITLSAIEGWSLMEGIHLISDVTHYESILITHLTGIIHQKTI
jgi:hypothetical protein